MSVEAEIKVLVESSKIGKQLKEKLIAIGNKKDNEFSCIQAEMVKLNYNKIITKKVRSFKAILIRYKMMNPALTKI